MLTAPRVDSEIAPPDSSRHSAVNAMPVMGPLTSGSRTSFKKGERYSRGCTTDQSGRQVGVWVGERQFAVGWR